MYISPIQETLILTSGLTIVVCSVMYLFFKSLIKSAIKTLIEEERLNDLKRKAEKEIEIDKISKFDPTFIYNPATTFKVSQIEPKIETKKPPVKPIPMPIRRGKVLDNKGKSTLKLSLSESGFIPSTDGEIEVELSNLTISNLNKAKLIEIINESIFLNGNYERILEIEKSDHNALISLSKKYMKKNSDIKDSASLESIQCHSCNVVSNSTEWLYKNETDISCPECGADL
ncbi:hypothetical protein [Aliivibrio fischeri]|uniref:hypothetical protein n=1 Tax=Aliivibrio fischeri TaxID=668 RepID=UPI0012D8F48F|nr:hypothetical protein [Aliivibrio fischeri]MUJ20330.1 hypothetical protein [Aliivibrio fischeri]